MNAHESKEIAAPTEEPVQAEAPELKPKKKGRSKREAGQTMTLAERYIEHLEAEGKSHGTCFSYGIEMRTASKALGAETLISSLTTEVVRRYFDSDAVMKLKNGRPKAAPSYLKTQRVLRLALLWAETQGWLDRAPIPQANEVK